MTAIFMYDIKEMKLVGIKNMTKNDLLCIESFLFTIMGFVASFLRKRR